MYILLILVISAVLCSAVVYPLWLFATTSPHRYTVLVIAAALLFLVCVIAARIIRNWKSCTSAQERRNYALRIIFRLLIILAAATALIFSIRLVLSEKRLIALAVFASGTAVTLILGKLKARISDA